MTNISQFVENFVYFENVSIWIFCSKKLKFRGKRYLDVVDSPADFANVHIAPGKNHKAAKFLENLKIRIIYSRLEAVSKFCFLVS